MYSMEYDIDKVTKDFMYEGFFSEYLPSNFNLRDDNIDIFNDIDISQQVDYIEPYSYTMSRFTDNDRRRVIYLPELSAYILVVNYMKDNNIIKELIDFSLQSKNSFSKLIQNDGSLTKHDETYTFNDEVYTTRINDRVLDEEFSKSTYISNVIEKINRGKGAKGILTLDISNFYKSIYTHIIPAIILGYENAIKQYKFSLANDQDERITNSYRIYRELDRKVRMLNAGRTNGLLTGNLISYFIAEALLTRIDKEIYSKKINFVRYGDDYEVFIYDEENIDKIINELTSIMDKYHLSFNGEKTKYTKFPYYVIENLEKIYNNYAYSELDSVELIEMFNNFFDMEERGIKGAVRYLIKSIDRNLKINDYELYMSYLLNTLVNDNRSLTKVCELIIRDKDKLSLTSEHISIILKLLIHHISREKDLEVIWLIFLLKNLGIFQLDDEIIKNVMLSKNDLAKIIILHEYEDSINDEIKDICINYAKSWILLYQLFLKDYINKDEFITKTGIRKNAHFYGKLKYNQFSFYKNI